MNADQIRNDILANLDKLPTKFSAGQFYNNQIDCMCIFGWLDHVVNDSSKEQLQPPTGDPSSVWDLIRDRYHIGLGLDMKLLRKADGVIHIYDGDPRPVVDYFLTYTLPEVAASA